jgi:hypothetical protein
MERRFLALFTATALLLVGGMLGMNWYVDPFARRASLADGFDREPAYTLNRRLFKLIAFDRWMAEHQDRAPSLLIGDSTANQISAAELTKLTGRPWYSLAFGGAGLQETIEMVDHVLQHYPVAEIAWGIPFARMIGDVEGDMPRSIDMAAAPMRHMLTYEALQASMLVLRATWLGIPFEDPKLDTGDQDVVTYQLSRTRTELAGRPWPGEELARLTNLLEQARRRGIPVTLFSPPVHPRTNDLFAADFADRYARYQDFLSGHCLIDFNDPLHRQDWSAELFSDSSHLAREHRSLLARALVKALPTACTELTTSPEVIGLTKSGDGTQG